MKTGDAGGENGLASSEKAVDDAGGVLAELDASRFDDEAAAELQIGNRRDSGGAEVAAASAEVSASAAPGSATFQS